MHDFLFIGGNVRSATYQDTDSSTSDLTTYTFSGMAFGAADSDRRIIVAFGGAPTGVGSPQLASSITIGGVAATVVAQATTGAAGAPTAGIAIAAVPTGTTGDVVITFTGALARAWASTYSTSGLTSSTATDSGTSSADPATDTLATTNNGFMIGAAFTNTSDGGGNEYTWSNITEDVEALVEGAAFSSAHINGTAAGTASPSANYISSDARRMGAFASW